MLQITPEMVVSCEHCKDQIEAFSAVKTGVVVFWVMTPCSLARSYQRFGET
jgi:hypothetical protein